MMMKNITVPLAFLTGVLTLNAAAQQAGQQLYERGMKVYKVDVQASTELLKQAAKKSHVDAMVRLAYIYQTGKNPKPLEALSWYQKAVAAGNTSAIYEIGSIYENGFKRIDKDYTKAIHWYQRGISNNSIKCVEGLTGIYASCDDPAYHDGGEAMKLAMVLIKKDSRNAEYMDLLAAACARNLNFDQAMKAASQAVTLSSLDEAAHRRKLRGKYQQGMPYPPIATDVWILQAAEKENLWAVMQLAVANGDELSEDYDPVTARHWYEIAAQNGHADAQLKLGRMVFLGEGGDVDMKKAFWYFSEALEGGNKKAYAQMGRMYLGGKGTRQDLEKAQEYYTLAQEEFGWMNNKLGAIKRLVNFPNSPDQLYKKAMAAIADTSLKPDGKPKTYAQKTNEVVSFFWLAAEQDQPEAMKELADIYFYGKRYFVRDGELDKSSGGLSRNYAKALDYYRQLANRGIESAEREPCQELYLVELKEQRKREAKQAEKDKKKKG